VITWIHEWKWGDHIETGVVRYSVRWLRLWGPESNEPSAFHALYPEASKILMGFKTHEEAQAWLDTVQA